MRGSFSSRLSISTAIASAAAACPAPIMTVADV